MDSIFNFQGWPQQGMFLRAQPHDLGDFPRADETSRAAPLYQRFLLALADRMIDSGNHLRCLAQKAQPQAHPLSRTHV